MLLHNEGGRLATGGDRETDGAISRFDLDDQGAEHIDAEARRLCRYSG